MSIHMPQLQNQGFALSIATRITWQLIMAADNERFTKFPLQGLTDDGWSTEEEATATCACGAVQMVIVSTLQALGN
jgi:hypothetical protein